MKRFIVVLLLVVLSCATAFATPDFITSYESKKGTVTFNHQVHSTLYDCAKCHTPTHQSAIEVDKAYGHSTCKSCHKESIADYPNAPVSCTGCHIK